MERLLTDEEIQEFKLKARRLANDLANTNEGHFKQEDIEGIYLEADKAMVKEQDTRTLKAVGEDYYCIPYKWCKMHPLVHFDGMAGCWGISSGKVLEQGEDYCKGCEYYKGEMPEERTDGT